MTTTTRRCPACRTAFADDRLSCYCVTCQAQQDAAFRLAANFIADAFARMARERGNEAEARRIERGKR